MLDALILDLGNVLVFHDNEKLYREMASAFRISVEGMRSRLDAAFWEQVNRGQLPGDQLRRALVERLGAEVDAEAWFSLWNCHFTLHDRMIEVVERLVERLPMVLLSNTHDQHFAYLHRKIPVLDRFRGHVLSYQLGAIKPEPTIYQQALRLTGVAAHRVAFFDDIARYAEAATRLGIGGRVFTTVDVFLADLDVLGVDVSDLQK